MNVIKDEDGICISLWKADVEIPHCGIVGMISIEINHIDTVERVDDRRQCIVEITNVRMHIG